VISIAFHLLLGGVLVRGVRVAPADRSDNPEGTVELLMVEQKGSGKPAPPPQPSPPQPPVPQGSTAAQDAKPPPPSAAEAKAVAEERPAPPPAEQGDVPPPPPPQPQAEAAKPADPAPVEVRPQKPDEKVQQAMQAPPPAPEKQKPLEFDLEGTDSESNAIVMGGHVLPASPDDRYRNRPPIYPYEAEIRGEHGSVVVLIHVSEYGAAAGADIAETSGVPSLDRAALDAVRKWHFHPALKDGKAVPFDMPMRFVFRTD
jgi:protein TonB